MKALLLLTSLTMTSAYADVCGKAVFDLVIIYQWPDGSLARPPRNKEVVPNFHNFKTCESAGLSAQARFAVPHAITVDFICIPRN